MVKEGTRWTSYDGKVFHVVHVIEIEGKTWVHYEQDNVEESRCFSCYEESFVSRFVPLPE